MFSLSRQTWSNQRLWVQRFSLQLFLRVCLHPHQSLTSHTYSYTTTDSILTSMSFVLVLSPFLFQAVPMSPGLAVPGPEISVLLSPSAFQQSINKTAASVVPPAPSEPSSTSAGAVEPAQAPCSKTQLQETLIHLIKVQQGCKIDKSNTVGTVDWNNCILKTSIKLKVWAPKFQKKQI